MSLVYVLADLHLGHKNICNFRTQFSSVEEHNEVILDNYRSVITKRDTVIFLGDVAFTRDALEAVKGLEGNKVLVAGNHDTERGITMRDLCDTYGKVFSMWSRKGCWLTHAPLHPDELRGKFNIHGHCVSDDTEILTKDGWKSYKDISIGEDIYSLNIDSGALEDDKVESITLREEYTGDVYEVHSKGLRMKMTSGHRVLMSTKMNKNFYEVADKALSRSIAIIPRSGLYQAGGVELLDDMLRLYIQIAADGNITPTGLCRINLHKLRKKDRIKSLLDSLLIDYSHKKYEDSDREGFNFRMPEELLDWKIKGLDKRLLQCSRRQVSVIRDEYRETDGNRDLIFTSKKCEVDLLQHLFTINGFICKVHERVGHGYSKGISYQLSVTEGTERMVSNIKAQSSKYKAEGEVFWCVSTRNTNFIARYQGCVFITGNCHSATIPDPRYYNVSMENIDYKPKRFIDIKEELEAWKTVSLKIF